MTSAVCDLWQSKETSLAVSYCHEYCMLLMLELTGHWYIINRTSRKLQADLPHFL